MTYILANPSTRYHNGLDAHLDTRVSSFLAKQPDVGLVGCNLLQITGDHGAPERSSEVLIRALRE